MPSSPENRPGNSSNRLAETHPRVPRYMPLLHISIPRGLEWYHEILLYAVMDLYIALTALKMLNKQREARDINLFIKDQITEFRPDYIANRREFLDFVYKPLETRVISTEQLRRDAIYHASRAWRRLAAELHWDTRNPSVLDALVALCVRIFGKDKFDHAIQRRLRKIDLDY